MRKILLISVLALFPLTLMAQSEMLTLARKTNEHLMKKWPDPTEVTFVKRKRTSNLWTRAVYYEGLMSLYEVDKRQEYIDYTDRWAKHHQWAPRGGNDATNADNQCCGQTYLDRYMMTGDTACMNNVQKNLDYQISTGKVDYWTWIDAIQMAMPVYSKMYRITSDKKYLKYAMQSYHWTRDTCGGGLFNLSEGLWWRDKDYVPPYKESDGKNCYWSRGNGWVYAALVRVMSDLDASDKNRTSKKAYKTLKHDFILMSEALTKCQRTDGFWNVSLVSPVTYGGPEMTGTALFLYGMSWGILNGILDHDTYRPICDKAWRALASCVHDNGFLGYNQGTGKDPSAGQPVTFTSMPDFEDYGTGCFILGAVEYHKLVEQKGKAVWPAASVDAKPGTRWWWLGSAIDHENLVWNMSEYAKTGIGAVEITPLYGVKGNEANELTFLSEEWMNMLSDVEEVASRHNIQVDMNCGTGWPFGGPEVPLSEAACKVLFLDTLILAEHADTSSVTFTLPAKEQKYARLICKKAFREGEGWRVIGVYESRTRQKVKRAAPGGEGYVLNHFDSAAVANYLKIFDKAFSKYKTKWPRTFFNDSYEVYRANWTPGLFEEFAVQKGYRLEDHLPELLGYKDDGGNVLADYRETLSELLYRNFTQQWVEWAHKRGIKIRNQAHGSPSNLLDLYAAVDIPEIEGFGLSDFKIKGLRTDPGNTRPNYSDVSMLKYASSAAHVTGKRLTSSETFTWLTEHFRTSLSQMKPDLDLMFTCGVNNIFFHGTCYSPKDDPWPGWKFYASIDMSPTNTIWRDAPYMMQYIERSQSFLQMGQPDNDFLVYLPVRDMWKKRMKEGADGLLMQFDIHSMDKIAPEFIRSILAIDSLGYDCDYISDKQLQNVTVKDGRIVTPANTQYKALIIPSGATLNEAMKKQLEALAPYVIYGEDDSRMQQFAEPEAIRRTHRLRAIRRKNDEGYHYFIANLTPNDVNDTVRIAVNCKAALWYNPMNGEISRATVTPEGIHMALRSGESLILKTLNDGSQILPAIKESSNKNETITLDNPWTLTFTEEQPAIAESFTLTAPQTWEALTDSTRVMMGTGIYTTTVTLNKSQAAGSWQIDLGDVRESARVYINDTFIGCAWAVPFTLDCGKTLRQGDNVIRIEVTNLPANRIADYDRRNIPWRKMKEINVVDINYKKTTYGNWKPMKSGLNSQVRLVSK